jgi:hypothetical protein
LKQKIAILMCAAVFGLVTLSSHAIAQQKTTKACREEWQANKAANQANGITERAYVDQCRSGTAPAQTTAAPSAPASAPTAAATGQKTTKACREEWQANKAANQANGITEKAYVDQCRSGAAPAQTTAAPSAPASAPTAAATGQKTTKACREEWQANKAANQANGITERAYVDQCRSGAAPAQTATPSAPAPAPTAAATGQKTAKACREEWQANKAANQANGITERAYVDQCRSGAAPSQTTAAPPAPAPTASPAAPAPAPTAAIPPTRPAPQPTSTARTPPTPANPVEANEFSTEAQAKGRCPTDTVVWANLKSKVYHFGDTRYYGNTEHGAYMCERDATAAGMRAAKNETHP